MADRGSFFLAAAAAGRARCEGGGARGGGRAGARVGAAVAGRARAGLGGGPPAQARAGGAGGAHPLQRLGCPECDRDIVAHAAADADCPCKRAAATTPEFSQIRHAKHRMARITSDCGFINQASELGPLPADFAERLDAAVSESHGQLSEAAAALVRHSRPAALKRCRAGRAHRVAPSLQCRTWMGQVPASPSVVLHLLLAVSSSSQLASSVPPTTDPSGSSIRPRTQNHQLILRRHAADT